MAVLTSTLPDLPNFALLLSLFMFMYAILGMYLFGAKFSFPIDDSCVEDCIYEDDRSNFNNLYWAFLTVFQLLTVEDFPGVMYSAVRVQAACHDMPNGPHHATRVWGPRHEGVGASP